MRQACGSLCSPIDRKEAKGSGRGWVTRAALTTAYGCPEVPSEGAEEGPPHRRGPGIPRDRRQGTAVLFRGHGHRVGDGKDWETLQHRPGAGHPIWERPDERPGEDSPRVVRHQGPPPSGLGRPGRGSDLAQEIFGLSDHERGFIERADKGFGVLFTEQGRVPYYNRLTEGESSCFKTKPASG